MTGLHAQGDHLYIASTRNNRAFRYNLPGIWGRTSSTSFGGGSSVTDIARTQDGVTWVATGDGEVPLRAFDASNRLIGQLDSSLGITVTGVTIDRDGYLWVSEQGSNRLLRIDVSL